MSNEPGNTASLVGKTAQHVSVGGRLRFITCLKGFDQGFYSPMAGRHFLLFHPGGLGEFEQWQWTMVEREAPRAVKQIATERAYSGQYMAGTIAPDDVENLERITEAMRAPRNWRRSHHYGLQLGHEQEGPRGLPGNLGPNPSEVNQRNFYRFWVELMERE